jgi:hypothetical protein
LLDYIGHCWNTRACESNHLLLGGNIGGDCGVGVGTVIGRAPLLADALLAGGCVAAGNGFGRLAGGCGPPAKASIALRAKV